MCGFVLICINLFSSKAHKNICCKFNRIPAIKDEEAGHYPRHPNVANFGVRAFHGGPGDPMRSLVLADITHVSGESVIESSAINVLCVRGKVRLR